MIGYILGLYRGNEKENGNDYLVHYVCAFPCSLGPWLQVYVASGFGTLLCFIAGASLKLVLFFDSPP